MKAQIVLLLVTLYGASTAMELRRRPQNTLHTCVPYTEMDSEKSDNGVMKKLLENKTNDNSVLKNRVFSEVNQKENPTPVATLIVGSVAICCSGLFMLWGEYEKNK